MPINKLAHVAIRSTNLEATRRFYVDILGMREGFRPPFNFPGLWLYGAEDERDCVHVIGIDQNDPSGLIAYLGDRAEGSLYGSASVDHIAFQATDLPEMLRKLEAVGLPYRERTVPGLGVHQLFVEDPSGVTVELNFPAQEDTTLKRAASRATAR